MTNNLASNRTNQQLRGRAPAPVPTRVHITSGAQWTRDCASRWRSCVEEVTRWSNDPPLGAKHAIVQRDSRFPSAIHLWAHNFKKFPHKRKQISKSANCPCVQCCVRFPGCSWPRPSKCRSTVSSCDLGKDSSGRRATPSLLRAPLWTLQITDNIFLRPVTGLPPAQDATPKPPVLSSHHTCCG